VRALRDTLLFSDREPLTLDVGCHLSFPNRESVATSLWLHLLHRKTIKSPDCPRWSDGSHKRIRQRIDCCCQNLTDRRPRTSTFLLTAQPFVPNTWVTLSFGFSRFCGDYQVVEFVGQRIGIAH
jgi:hypothetical protein